MKNFLFVLGFILVITGCVTDKKLLKNYDRFLLLAGKQESKTEYRDTTVTISQQVIVPVKADSVEYDGNVSIINGKAELKEVTLTGNFITGKVSVIGGKLHVRMDIAKREVPVMLTANITLPGAIRETKSVTILEKKFIPAVYLYSFYIILFAVIALVGYFVLIRMNLLKVAITAIKTYLKII